jgi:small-conductance mechanosensitive channel
MSPLRPVFTSRALLLVGALCGAGGAAAQTPEPAPTSASASAPALAENLANARAAVVALDERHAELEAANRDLTEKLRELDQANKELAAGNARLKQSLATSQAAARKFSAQLARRTYRNVSRHVAAMPAVAIPYVGAGVTASMTALDIREGCEALRELNEMNRAMQLEPESEAAVCAMQVGSREEIINKVLGNWRTAYAVAAAWTNQQEIWLAPEPVPVEPARAIELWSAVFGSLPNPSARAAAAASRGPLPPTPPVAPVLPGYPAR